MGRSSLLAPAAAVAPFRVIWIALQAKRTVERFLAPVSTFRCLFLLFLSSLYTFPLLQDREPEFAVVYSCLSFTLVSLLILGASFWRLGLLDE